MGGLTIVSVEDEGDGRNDVRVARARPIVAETRGSWPCGQMLPRRRDRAGTRRWRSLTPIAATCLPAARSRPCLPPSPIQGKFGLQSGPHYPLPAAPRSHGVPQPHPGPDPGPGLRGPRALVPSPPPRPRIRIQLTSPRETSGRSRAIDIFLYSRLRTSKPSPGGAAPLQHVRATTNPACAFDKLREVRHCSVESSVE